MAPRAHLSCSVRDDPLTPPPVRHDQPGAATGVCGARRFRKLAPTGIRWRTSGNAEIAGGGQRLSAPGLHPEHILAAIVCRQCLAKPFHRARLSENEKKSTYWIFPVSAPFALGFTAKSYWSTIAAQPVANAVPLQRPRPIAEAEGRRQTRRQAESVPRPTQSFADRVDDLAIAKVWPHQLAPRSTRGRSITRESVGNSHARRCSSPASIQGIQRPRPAQTESARPRAPQPARCPAEPSAAARSTASDRM